MSLQVEIRHRLGAFALDAAFEAPAGLTALFGRSGSGKTTVVNAVAGLLRPDEARITVGTRVLHDSAAGLFVPVHKRRLGYVFQDARLFPHLTVEQNLCYGQRRMARPLPGPDMATVVELLGIGHLLTRTPISLSGGEKQRVAIGRALLSHPQMLLMDEPLAALDAARKAEILPYLERLRDDLGLPILYVSHSMAEVARLATSVVLLDNGRVVKTGRAEEVLSDPDTVRQIGLREAGAVLSARVMCHHADGLTELGAAGGPLFLPRLNAAVGQKLRIRILAQDVMLATERPQALSALNILDGRIVELREGAGPGVIAQIDCGGDKLLARVTRRSAQALGLQAGARVFAVIKSVSVAPVDVGAN